MLHAGDDPWAHAGVTHRPPSAIAPNIPGEPRL